MPRSTMDDIFSKKMYNIEPWRIMSHEVGGGGMKT